MKSLNWIVTFATLLTVVSAEELQLVRFSPQQEAQCQKKAGRIGLRDLRTSATELEKCLNSLDVKNLKNAESICADLGVRLGCVQKLTGAVTRCLSHDVEQRALNLENSFKALKEFFCRQTATVQSRIWSGEMNCVLRKWSDIIGCSRMEAPKNMSTSQLIAAEFNHSRPHSATDYCQSLDRRQECVEGHVQGCSKGVRQLVVGGVAAMRNASPCLLSSRLQNAGPQVTVSSLSVILVLAAFFMTK